MGVGVCKWMSISVDMDMWCGSEWTWVGMDGYGWIRVDVDLCGYVCVDV